MELTSKSTLDSEEEKLSLMLSKLDMVSVLEAKEIYDSCMQAFPTSLGKAVSKKERELQSMKEPTLVYGEITFETFGTVIEKIRKVYGRPGVGSSGPAGFLQSRGGIFYDLGSGTGKPVIAAAIMHNFDICYGIELLEGLYSISLDVLSAYNTKGKSKLSNRESDTHVQMIQGDFLKMRTKDWRDGDIIFANSTCYDENLMAKISHLAAGLKKGAFVITLTKRLPSSDFTVLEYEMYPMSWGDATIFIHQKTTDSNEGESDEDSDIDGDINEEKEDESKISTNNNDNNTTNINKVVSESDEDND